MAVTTNCNRNWKITLSCCKDIDTVRYILKHWAPLSDMWSNTKGTCIYTVYVSRYTPDITCVFLTWTCSILHVYMFVGDWPEKAKWQSSIPVGACVIPPWSLGLPHWRGDMCTVTVTGGAGFLGQHVIQHLQLSAPWVTEIRVFDLIPFSRSLGINFKICILNFEMLDTNAWQYMCLLYM